MVGRLRVVESGGLPRVGRRTRKPVHTFQLRTRPFHIQPFMIAPVLPGETMQNLLLQSRVVSDPIKNPLLGWWKEYYFFYVPHLALHSGGMADECKEMMLDQTHTFSAGFLSTAATSAYYAGKGSVKWVYNCLAAVTEEFFRDEGEDATASHTVWADGIPLAQVKITNSGLQSLLDDTTAAGGGDDADLPGEDELEDESILPGFETHTTKFELMRDQMIEDPTYDDYLRTYGIKGTQVEQVTEEKRFKPELLRFVRSWTYPTNTINPTDGAPSSAVSWAIRERADKKRLFKYPGFIFGVTVTRPKLYLGNQSGNLAGYLKGAFDWLPSILADNPETSLRQFSDPSTLEDGPLGTTPTNGYWLDMRDVFMHGDQFINFARSATDAGLLALPNAALGHLYAAEADIDALFDNSASNKIKEDGVVSLNILGRAGRDFT